MNDDPNRGVRFAWAKLNAYGILLAGIAILTVANLINPSNEELDRVSGLIPFAQPLWVSGFVVAGGLMMFGFLRADRVAETIGLGLLDISLLIQTVVAIFLFGVTDYTVNSAVVLLVAAGCSWARIAALWSKHGLVITILMGYPQSRSMNLSLSEGSTDGKYKKVIRDRDGVVEPATYESRADLNDGYFGIHEKKVKVAPDGLLHATPNFVPTPVLPGTDSY
jgi:hypothetical protein